MPKTKISEFSATPGNNTDIDGINIAEGCAPSGINDAIRELMAQLKDFQAGTAGDSFNGPVGTTTAAAGAFTTLSASSTVSGAGFSTYLASPPAIGGTAAAAGSFTTLTTSSTVTHNGGTANGVAYLNGSKVLTTGSALTFDGTSIFGVTSSTVAVAKLFGGTGAGNGSYFALYAQGANAGYVGTDSGITGGGTSNDLTLYPASTNNIRFYQGGSEQMRLTSTGLGIGTSSPSAKLHVSGGRTLAITGNESYSLGIGRESNTNAYYLGVHSTTNPNLLFSNNAGTTNLTLTYDGNLGLGVTPSAWGGSYKAFNIVGSGSLFSNNQFNTRVGNNLYHNGTNFIYNATGFATYYSQNDAAGTHAWYTAPSGTAGNAITFTQAMTLDASGNLLLGTTTSPSGSSKVVFRQSGTSSPDATWNGSVWGLAAVGGEPALYLSSNIVAATGVAGATQTAKGGMGFRYVSAANPTEFDIGIIGTSTVAGPVCFYNDTERARITSGGNLGIGTTSPQKPLHVYGSTAAVGNATMIVEGATGGYGAGVSFQSVLTGGSLAEMARITADGEAAWNTTASTQDAGLRFYTALDGTVAEKIRLDASGNLGIGTTTIGSRVTIGDPGTGLSFTNAASGNFNLGLLAGTGSADAYVYQRANNPLIFGTNNTERARITSVGAWQVNTSGVYTEHATVQRAANEYTTTFVSPRATAAQNFGLQVTYSAADPNGTGNFFLYCEANGTIRANIRSNGGIANYSANNVNLSDRREKTNFAPAKSYIDAICAIPVQTFNYVDQNMEEDPGLTLGVVAQDVQAVAPELVMESNWAKEGEAPKMRLSIYQTDLQYALMKCIQEQQVMINELKAKVAALEAK